MRHSLTPFFVPLDTETRGRVYISGAMTDQDAAQEVRFESVADSLREAGYAVCNPYDTSRILGDLTHQRFLRFDFQRILEADWIVALSGWEDSPGCRAELHMALTMGVPVFETHGSEYNHVVQVFVGEVTDAISCA